MPHKQAQHWRKIAEACVRPSGKTVFISRWRKVFAKRLSSSLFTKGKVWISFISDPSPWNNDCGMVMLSSYLLNKWEAAIILGLFDRKCTIEIAEEEEEDGE